MFKINKKKRIFVSAFVALAVILPAVAFAAGNLAKSNDSYALPSDADMKTAAIASGFGSSDNIVNLWQCVVKAKYSSPTDANYTTAMSSSDLASITTLNCPYSSGTKITDINGLRQLTGLKTMNLSGHAFPSIKLSYFTNLETLNLSNNTTMHTLSGATNLTKLQSINLSGCSALYNGKAGEEVEDGWLRLNGDSALTTVNLSGVTKLEYLDFQRTGLTSLNLSSQTALKKLLVNEAALTSITFPNTNTLQEVGLAENNLPSTITLPSSCGIKYLNLRDNPRLSTITNLNKCSNLLSLAIQNDSFSRIDISSNTNLIALKATNNNFPDSYAIDITNNKSLANIQLNSDDYIKATDVTPVAVSGGYKYDFSAYNFIYRSVVEFRSHSGLTSSGEVVTVTNYSATDGWVPVSQAPDPLNSPCGLDGDTTISDDYGCNDSEYTRFKNHYRVLLDPVDEGTTYTVTYNANGGSNAPRSQTCSDASNCQVTITNSQPTRSGYTFTGWATTSGGSVRYMPGQTIPLTSNITLYAVWEQDTPDVFTYTLTFNPNGGTGAPSVKSCSGAGSCQVSIPSGQPTRDGYTFLGWANSSTATSPSSSYEVGDAVTLTDNKTIYAVWRENSAEPTTKTLTYDANGGTNAPRAQSCSSVSSCNVTITSDEPTRDGYTFLGWSPNQGATTPVYVAGDERALSDNLTLYAVWEANPDDANSFVLAFDANGGKNAPSNVSCQGATSCSTNIPNTKPTRTGYTFKGWAATADAEEATYKPGDSIVIAENTTLYAVWEAVTSSGVATPDTGAATQGGANGLAAVLGAMPIIGLGVFLGTKLYRGRKLHIKLD